MRVLARLPGPPGSRAQAPSRRPSAAAQPHKSSRESRGSTSLQRQAHGGSWLCTPARPASATAARAAPAAAAAAAAPAAVATFFPAATWAAGTAAWLGLYLLYWACLAVLMPKGHLLGSVESARQTPAMRRLRIGVILAAFLSTFVLPLIGMAACGAWRAGAVYFLPIMIQTVINVSIEQRAAKSGRILAVYGSTVGNSMSRLGLCLAALYDMSRLATPHPALLLVSCIQAVTNLFIQLLMVPASISTLPVMLVESVEPMGREK